MAEREPWFPESTLTQEQQERAVRWADEMVAEGHHGFCSSRAGRECDCYFSRSDYLAARLLAEIPDPKNSHSRPRPVD